LSEVDPQAAKSPRHHPQLARQLLPLVAGADSTARARLPQGTGRVQQLRRTDTAAHTGPLSPRAALRSR